MAQEGPHIAVSQLWNARIISCQLLQPSGSIRQFAKIALVFSGSVGNSAKHLRQLRWSLLALGLFLMNAIWLRVREG